MHCLLLFRNTKCTLQTIFNMSLPLNEILDNQGAITLYTYGFASFLIGSDLVFIHSLYIS